MSLQANPGSQLPAKKKGCFYYGCLTALIILVVLIVGIYLGYRYVKSQLIENYTQTTAVALPALDSSTPSYLRVKEKVEGFQAAARSGKPASIDLTAQEINTYLSSQPGLEGVTDYFRVAIEKNDLRGLVSFPLDTIGYPGRYLNGTLSLRISMLNGNLDLRIAGLQVGNSSLPDAMLAELAGQNLFDEMKPEGKKELLDTLQGVKTINVENGMLKMAGGQ